MEECFVDRGREVIFGRGFLVSRLFTGKLPGCSLFI